jgi:hypothetical protein
VNTGDVASVIGAPVGGIGQKLTFTLKGFNGLLQSPFSVKVKRYSGAARVFSAVTLQGHPLAGWRYWRAVQLGGGTGHLLVESGAIDTPGPGLKNLIGFWYTQSDQLRIWQEELEYILRDSGARQVPDYGSALTAGVWGYDKSYIQNNICDGEAFCK